VRRASDGTLVLQLSGSWKLLDQLTYPALVEAMRRGLDGLSREIAGVLKTL
jgi:hypothetical protein